MTASTARPTWWSGTSQLRNRPVVGGRPDVCEEAHGVGLRGVLHRRVLAHGGRLADLQPSSHEITTDNTYTTPADFEALYYRHHQPVQEAVTQ